MKRILVFVAVLATAAIAATPAFAGSTTWGGNGVSEGETCTEGAHWILSPGDGISSATLTVNGETVTMVKNGPADGNGSLSAVTSGAVDLSTDASATWDGPDGAFLKVSDCFGSQTTTGGATTGQTTGGSTTGASGGVSGSTTGGTTGGTAATPSGGDLPFTGLPAWIPLLAAAFLLGSGFFLARRRPGDVA